MLKYEQSWRDVKVSLYIGQMISWLSIKYSTQQNQAQLETFRSCSKRRVYYSHEYIIYHRKLFCQTPKQSQMWYNYKHLSNIAAPSPRLVQESCAFVNTAEVEMCFMVPDIPLSLATQIQDQGSG